MRSSVLSIVSVLLLSLPTRAADYFWNNTAGGSYFTAANWGGIVPAAADNVTIALVGTYNVTLPSAASVTNFTLNNAGTTFLHSGGLYTASGTVTLTAGVYSINSGGTLAASILTGTVGTLRFGTAAGTLNNVQIAANVLDFGTTNGRAAFTGGTSFTVPSTYTTASGFQFDVNQTQVINNLNLTLGSGASFRSGGVNGLTIGPLSTINAPGAASVTSSSNSFGVTNQGLIQNTGALTLTLGSLGTFFNEGIVRTTSTGILTLGSSPTTAWDNLASGLIDLQGGTANVPGTLSHTGTIKLAVGTTLNITGAWTFNPAGTFDRGGAPGSNGSINISGTLTFANNVNLHSATGPLNLTGSGIINGGGNTLSSTGTSRLVILGNNTSTLNNVLLGPNTLDLSSTGSLFVNFTGGTTFTAPAAYTFGTNLALRINQTQAVDNATFNLGNSSQVQVAGALGMTLGSNITIHYPGTANATANIIGSVVSIGPITSSGLISRAGTLGTLNFGTNVPSTNSGILRNSGTATTAVFNIGNLNQPFSHTAGSRVEALGGTTNISGQNWTSAGTFQIAAGAVLNLAGTYNSSTWGTFDRGGAPGNNGTLTLSGTVTLAGPLDVQTVTGPVNTNNMTILGGGNVISSTGAARVTPLNGVVLSTFDNVLIAPNTLDLVTTAPRIQFLNNSNFTAPATHVASSGLQFQIGQSAALENLTLTVGDGAVLIAVLPGLTLAASTSITHAASPNNSFTLIGSSAPMINLGLIALTGTATSGSASLGQGGSLTNGGIIRNASTNRSVLVGHPTQFFQNIVGGRIEALGGTTTIRGINWTNAGTFQIATNARLHLEGTFASNTLGTIDRGGSPGSNGTLALTNSNSGQGLSLSANFDLHSITGPIELSGGAIYGNGFLLSTSGASRVTPSGGSGGNNILNNVLIAPNVLDLGVIDAYLFLSGGSTFAAPSAFTTALGFTFQANQSQPIENLDLTLGGQSGGGTNTSARILASGPLGFNLGSTSNIRSTLNNVSHHIGASPDNSPFINNGLVIRTGGPGSLTIGTLQAGNSSPVTNAGIIRNAATTGVTNISTEYAFLNQSTGRVESLAGSVNISTLTATNEGMFQALAGTLTIQCPTFVNTSTPSGTLDAAGGTINIPGAGGFSNYTANTLTGGTYRVSASGILNFNTRPIAVLAAGTTVELTAPATFAALNSLTTINTGANLQLLGGQNLAVPGNLTNAGALVLTGGTLTVPGAFTNTGSFTMAGTLSAGLGITVAPGGNLAVQGTVIVPVGQSVTISSVSGNPGILTGGGTINGHVVLMPNSIIRPGSSPGVITIIGGIELDGTFDWDLAGNSVDDPGTGHDRIQVSGGADVKSNGTVAMRMGPAVSFSHPFWQTPRSWKILVVESGGLTGQFTEDPQIIEGPTPGSLGSFHLQNVLVGNTGEVQLIWTPANPVPEPAILLATLAIGVVFLVRRSISERFRCQPAFWS